MHSHLRRRRARAAAATVVALLAGLAASGCAGDDSPSAAAEAPNAPKTSEDPRVHLSEPSVAHPRRGDCHNLSAAEASNPHDTKDTVRCRRSHSAETFYVGTFDLNIIGDRNPTTADIAGFVTPRCSRYFGRWIGGDRSTRLLSRLHPVWFVPTQRDIGLGARWFRCDVVAASTDTRLAELPRDTKGLLDSSTALDEYGLCSRGSPERRRSDIVICSRSHSWQAFDVLRLKRKGDAYPTRKQLREAGDRCQVRARRELDFPLEWKYGWQPPTRSQWDGGMRWGVCWVPSD